MTAAAASEAEALTAAVACVAALPVLLARAASAVLYCHRKPIGTKINVYNSQRVVQLGRAMGAPFKSITQVMSLCSPETDI